MERDTLKLRPEQEDMLAKIRLLDWVFIIGKMRVGKTLPAAIGSKEMGGGTLIVAPANTIPHWHETLKLIGHDDYEAVSYGKMNRIYKDTFQKSSIYKKEFTTLIIDECHELRSFSQQYQCVRKIVNHFNFKKKIALTGTLIDGKMSDVFYPISLMTDRYGTSKNKFYELFCKCVNPGSKYPKFEILEQIYDDFVRSLNEFSFFYVGKDIVHPKVIEVKYGLLQKQKRVLKALYENDPIPEIFDEHASLDKAIKNNKARQILSGFYILKNKEVVYPCFTKKWAMLRRILYAHNNARRAILWVAYNEEKELIADAMWNRSVGEFSKKNLELFNKDKLDILICHPKSAGQGVDFSHADIAVFTSQVHSSIYMEQALARLSKFKGVEGKKILIFIPESYKYNMYRHVKQKMKVNEELYESRYR